jgi:Zn-dependent protease with chaperone function
LTSRYDDVPEVESGLALTADRHPDLYAIVRRVSERVGTSPPDEIRVVSDPECYAVELRRFGLSTRRRLVVVLGFPNLAVLCVSELKVILAHELAHIALGDTRLEVFTVRFLGVLRAKIEGVRWRWLRWLDPLSWFYAGSYWLLLRLFAPLRRFQELRADRMSAALYGGELAAHTLLKDWLVVHEFYATLAAWAPSQPDAAAEPHDAAAEPHDAAAEPHDAAAEPHENVFGQFLQRWKEYSQPGQDYLERRLQEEERPSYWDTHPTVQDRVSVMRPYPPPQPPDPRPVRQTLPDFDQLAEQLQQSLAAHD